MTSRSFKPSSLSLRARRPSIGRTSSNSSTHSQERASPLSSTFTVIEAQESIQQNSGRSPTPVRSRPIAIELPPRRTSNHLNTPTPPEALSARGDILGGYFPLHEENQRSYKTHPFHHEPTSAKSDNNTNKQMPEPRSPLSTYGHAMTDSPLLSETYQVATSPDPLLMAMPQGKYHPSNYKNKTSPADNLAPLTPIAPSQPSHVRKKSDIKQKLQQYQRDMVEQAALAGRMEFPGAKPTSPRLQPLGSPGPVTPIELEEGGGYLGARAKALSQSELIARMELAEEEALRNKSSAAMSERNY